MTPTLAGLLKLARLIVARWSVYALMVAGLTLAYCAATIIGLYVRNELTYDGFIPGAETTYLVSAHYGPKGHPLIASDLAPAGVARWTRSSMPDVDGVTRLVSVEWLMQTDRRKVKEHFYWADANLFDIVKLPALHGELKTALVRPGSIVMTARMADAYFGRNDVVGETLLTAHRRQLTVTAVLRDFPPNTTFDREIFVSGVSDYSDIAVLDDNPTRLWPTSYTYLRVKSGSNPSEIAQKLGSLTRAQWRGPNNIPVAVDLIPLTRLHFQPHGDGQMKPRGHLNLVIALIIVAVAIIALASINVSGLILAETNERVSEMAIRAAVGASRYDLIAEIANEAFWVNAASMALALALSERVLPSLNRLLDLNIMMWTAPVSLLGVSIAITVMTSGLSGLYPAILVTRPRGHRRGALIGASSRWKGWVVTQIALVIVLLIASHTMVRQWRYAIGDAPNFDGNSVLMVKFSEFSDANARFVRDVRSLPGVIAAAESFSAPTTDYARPGLVTLGDGRTVALTRNSVAPEFFDVYRVPIVAGRNLIGTFLEPDTPAEILVNESGARALGYASPQEAVEKFLTYDTDMTRMRSKIVGVVPDLRFATVSDPAQPMIFDNSSKYFNQVSIRLDPIQGGEAISAIESAWDRNMGGSIPVDKRLFYDYLLQQYHDLYQQIQVFNLVSAVAILLSVLGLTGLSIFLTRHQVREMAIRRALGATFGDIFVQRLTPFFLPLLGANLVA